jgi:hypothetical protein
MLNSAREEGEAHCGYQQRQWPYQRDEDRFRYAAELIVAPLTLKIFFSATTRAGVLLVEIKELVADVRADQERPELYQVAGDIGADEDPPHGYFACDSLVTALSRS